MFTYLSVFLALAGTCVGALLQYRFSGRLEVSKQKGVLQADVYSKYLAAVAACAGNLPNATADLRDAKARLAVFGTRQVIEALAKFEQSGADLSEVHSRRAFIAVVLAMRSDDENALEPSALSLLLLSVEE